MSRRAVVAAAATLISLVLGGCATAPVAPPAAGTATASTAPQATAGAPSTTPTPARTPTPSPTPSPTPGDPHAGWQEVATPNGTATFRIPPGWTAEVGGERIDYDGEEHWVNDITVRSDTGAISLSYYDGPYDDVGAVADFGVVRSTPVATLDAAELASARDIDPAYLDHRASAWWTTGDGAMFHAHAGLASPQMADGQPLSMVYDGERSLSLGVRADFGSEADAVAWLESDEVTAVLQIVETLDLTAIPAPALP